jgi:hypothetical protein
MSALKFYFVSRNLVKVKFDLNSNRFVIYKRDFKIEKDFAFSFLPWAESLLHLESGPIGLCCLHPVRSLAEGRAIGLVA